MATDYWRKAITVLLYKEKGGGMTVTIVGAYTLCQERCIEQSLINKTMIKKNVGTEKGGIRKWKEPVD